MQISAELKTPVYLYLVITYFISNSFLYIVKLFLLARVSNYNFIPSSCLSSVDLNTPKTTAACNFNRIFLKYRQILLNSIFLQRKLFLLIVVE